MKKLLTGIAAILLLIPFTAVLAQDNVAEVNHTVVQNIYDEMNTTREMYEQMADQFGEPYDRFAFMQQRHAKILRTLAEEEGMAVKENPVDNRISGSEQEALQQIIRQEEELAELLSSLNTKSDTDLHAFLDHQRFTTERHGERLARFEKALADGTADDEFEYREYCRGDAYGYGMQGRRWRDDNGRIDGHCGMGRGMGMHRGGFGRFFDEDNAGRNRRPGLFR